MTKQEPSIPPWAAEELETARLRIAAPASAARLWERHLTVQQRAGLGGDLEAAFLRYRTAGMWMELHGVSYQRAVIDVAHVLGFFTDQMRDSLLRALNESLDSDEAVEHAVNAGSFVLVECPRTVSFGGSQLEIDWERYGSLWEFLWHLARHAKAGRPVDRLVFGEGAHANIVTDRKSKLSKLTGFPMAIIDRIEVKGNGTQQLCLPRDQIRIFEYLDGQLREWTP
jgi:hypothetical protein